MLNLEKSQLCRYYASMQITYYGHSCFKLKGKSGTVVTDPYSEEGVYGISMPKLSADIVTISHQHRGHNAIEKIKGAVNRKKPFIIDFPGEYEVGGISVFGVNTYHDQVNGKERGNNLMFTILIDGITVCHLGDLAHPLSDEQLKDLAAIDVLFLPVGGPSSLMGDAAVKVAQAISPNYVIPMHYADHAYPKDAPLKRIEDFFQVYGTTAVAEEKLIIEKDRLPEEMQLVVLSRT